MIWVKTKAGSFARKSARVDPYSPNGVYTGTLGTLLMCKKQKQTSSSKRVCPEHSSTPLGTVMDACGKAGQWQMAVSRGWT